VGPPGFEPGTFASSGNKALKIENYVKEYLEYRYSRIKSEKSKWWIKRVIDHLIEKTGGELSRERLLKFQNWYKTKYNYDGQCKFHDTTKNFLEWLYKRTGNPEFKELAEILERPKRNSKKINPIILREVDVENIITAIYDLPPSPYDPPYRWAYHKLKFIAAVLFAAYTGQRPESTINKLTFEDFEEALERDPPML